MPGARVAAVLLSTGALLAGCAGAEEGSVAGPAATATATATATVTVTATATPAALAEPDDSDGVLAELPSNGVTAGPSTPMPRLRLRVFRDGCGVIRSQEPAGSLQSLTWVFRDRDGFQVLGRNAAGETRYRYFAPGVYTVVLQAWGTDRYVPVSNEVTVHC